MFLQNSGKIFQVGNRGNDIEFIPAGVWLLDFNPMMGYHLVQQDPLVRPETLYGAAKDRATKVMNTFLSREGMNTGVLLTGNKGSGKTMLSKEISMQAIESYSMPVILIDQPFSGTDFTQFMNKITQQVVILIDEFEKKYKEEEDQNMLLSLLDGTGTDNKLYVLTSNKSEITPYMMSRPSRIFYHWEYAKLEEEILIGYCQDHLKHEKHLKHVKTLWSMSLDMSFDVLQCLVEELNRYPDEPFLDLIGALNITLGGGLKRGFRLKYINIDDVALPLYGEHQAQSVDLIGFQDGYSIIRSSARINSLKEQLSLCDEFGSSGFYCFGEKLALEKGEKTLEELEEDHFDEQFDFIFSYTPEEVSFSADRIIFRRQMKDGRNVEIKWEVTKLTTEREQMEQLFVED